MSTVLISILSFVVAVSIIVTVHEFGHFIVARMLGVRVLRFSVGFGRSLFSHVSRKSGVEYVLAAIPLGGYVKMLDEREGDVETQDLPYAFNRQSVLTRIAIVAAGPVFNFIFAIAAYLCMYLVGVQGMKPEIGQVMVDTPAYEAGLSAGDEFLQIGDTHVATWEQTNIHLIDEALKTGLVRVLVRTSNDAVADLVLDLSDTGHLLGEGNILEKIGMQPWRVELDPILGQLTEDGAARAQGLLPGDQIATANGEPVKNWRHWVEIVRSHPQKDINLTITRDSAQIDLVLQPEAIDGGNGKIGKIGAGPWMTHDFEEKARVEKEIEQHKVTVRYGPGKAFVKGVVKTLDMTILTVKLLGKLVIGEASLKNISGPISIAEYAGISAQLGLATFLSTLAIISISIGVLNLLPIPILDGGHLMYYLVEIFKGSPVSEATQMQAQKIGIFMLAGLMTLAFYNDFQRLFG